MAHTHGSLHVVFLKCVIVQYIVKHFLIRSYDMSQPLSAFTYFRTSVGLQITVLYISSHNTSLRTWTAVTTTSITYFYYMILKFVHDFIPKSKNFIILIYLYHFLCFDITSIISKKLPGMYVLDYIIRSTVKSTSERRCHLPHAPGDSTSKI